MKLAKLIVFALGVSAFAACADQPKSSAERANEVNDAKTDNAKMEEDAETLVQASVSDMMEIEAGRIATTMATNQSVRDFANMMIQEHTNMSNETKALAARKNYTLPASLPNDKMEKLNDMRTWEKDKFDNKYVESQIDMHQSVLNELERRANRTGDPDIRSWAQTAMNHVRTHLDRAKMLDDQRDNMDNNNTNRTGTSRPATGQ